MLFYSRCDRENVGVKDDVLGRETNAVYQDAVGPRTDVDLALIGVGLSVLVEGHDHSGGSVALDECGLTAKFSFAFFQADGVNDALTLHAL